MASKGEVKVDQAHRGYSVVSDDVGKVRSLLSLSRSRSIADSSSFPFVRSQIDFNPFYMKYSADAGFFDGQRGYGELFSLPPVLNAS